MDYAFLSTTPLKDVQFVSLDLETTGLDPLKSEIIEIAGIRFSKDNELERFHSFCRPSGNIPYEATKVHGLTKEMLQKESRFSTVYPDLLKFLDNSILVIQNSVFDASFLNQSVSDIGEVFPNFPVFCTLQMTRKHFPKLEKYNLGALRKVFNITKTLERSEQKEFHEALDDAYAAMVVFKKCIESIHGWDKTFNETVFHEKNLNYTSQFKKES
ncbi:MAG TPA: 3'-5' exonuclease [Leptospiraceae bacterium]|nr:3'-5' exonuclease [Leptospiraceae bacterium]HNF12055.1 3'-5' exonuclease [Leptospiraceae bacterium]HNF25762.1 3'-5' exonuclease [Leptospiraceae bacterium]HNI25521.1 3'-5' exonuclease [Leptospiraceae bacterium]HNI95950.1 3'-5' exonuclease [Leptospiraceae bacterium]